eukprot:TRINITY_DN340_c0_g8_i1.p1 TRINITY_DN340_c0_g8~~TRINITY_DN340_c0_g8_i1.p1  ORF type:complete len:322 (-),score=29.73 TRINITY_DN340_c0_g8_i1:343-1308(-)
MLLAPPQTAFPGQQAAFPEGAFFPPQAPAAYKWFPHPSYYQFDADYARNQPYMYPPAEFYPVEAWPNAMPAAPLAILTTPDGSQPVAQMPPISAHLVPEGMQFAPFAFDPHQHDGLVPHHMDSSAAHDWQRGGRANGKGAHPKTQTTAAKPRPKTASPTSGSIQVRKRDAKQLVDNTMSVEVLHKPRGSQGVWVAIESGQRVRVTYGRGKNVRVVVRSTQRRDWSSLRLFLVEHQDDDSEPVVEKESKHSFSVEAREVKTDLTSTDVPLQMVQFEVKVFMIHATISFRAEYDAPDGTSILSPLCIPPSFLCHRSSALTDLL